MNKAKRSSKLKNKKNWLLVVYAAILMALGVIVTMAVLFSVATPHKQNTITYSTDKPDETKPGKSYTWPGSPEDPKYIKLPSIKAEGYIQNVGVDQHSAVAVPANIHIAGWFTSSVRPGKEGLSIIDGHVDGWTTRGIFINLKNLKAGDEYTVEMGSGETFHYKVVKVDSVKTDKAAEVLFSQNASIKSQLNLITCGGKFDKKTNQYENRIIVTSELK